MLSYKPWSKDAVIRFFLGVFSTYCFGSILVGLLLKLKLPMSEDQRFALQLIISLIVMQFGSLLWVWLFLKEEHMSWKQAFGFKQHNIVVVLSVGILAGVLVFFISQGLMVMSEQVMLKFQMHPQSQEVVQQIEKQGSPIAQKFFVLALATLVAPLVEEILFRGILYTSVKQAGYPRLAFWASAILFAAAHLNLVTFIPLTFFAAVLILLYESTDNLLAPIAAHAVFNFANGLLLVFQEAANRGLPPTIPGQH